MAGVFVEPELENRVGAIPRDVGHEANLLEGSVCIGRGHPWPFLAIRWVACRSVSPERMDRCTGTLIIGG
jgi:hypothetical protein